MKKLSINEELYKIHQVMYQKNNINEDVNYKSELDGIYNAILGINSLIQSEDVYRKERPIYNKGIKSMQEALMLLGYDLPRFGADGFYGKETQSAVDKFAREHNIESTTNQITPAVLSTIMFLLKDRHSKLVAAQKYNTFINQNPFSKDQSSPLQVKAEDKNKSNFLTNIDLSTKEGFKKYTDICQAFISTKKPNPLNITGEMMAYGAQNAFYKYKNYVPPELALSQLVMEGGIGNPNLNAKPIRTKNPFNYKNYDDGRTHSFVNVQDGINTYYNLIARSYLSKDKTPESLFHNFTNINNNRYASDPNYESKLRSLAGKINQIAKNIA